MVLRVKLQLWFFGPPVIGGRYIDYWGTEDQNLRGAVDSVHVRSVRQEASSLQPLETSLTLPSFAVNPVRPEEEVEQKLVPAGEQGSSLPAPIVP